MDNDEKTFGVLLPPMHEKLVELYDKFQDLVAEHLDDDDENDEIMSSDDLQTLVESLCAA